MSAVTEARSREFPFSDRDFRSIRELVSEHTGIVLTDAKRDMVYSRLVKRLRHLGLDRFSSYCELLQDDPGDELIQFTNAITTNLTAFFREAHHFDYLRDTLIPRLLQENHPGRRIRIWSAGCSTGEEPYSLAMVLRECMPEGEGWDLKILATDLDSSVLSRAANGIYTAERISGLDRHRRQRWFLRGRGDHAGMVRVRPELRNMIVFKQLNLLKEWPMRGLFDVIFCRNVVIYFDKDTQRILFNRYANILRENGHLFVGHSESLFKVSDRFSLLGNTIYTKTG